MSVCGIDFSSRAVHRGILDDDTDGTVVAMASRIVRA